MRAYVDADVFIAILAATVMRTGGAIYCLNIHYPMPDLLVKKAW